MNIELKKTLRELRLIRILVDRGSYDAVYPEPVQREMVFTVLDTAITALIGKEGDTGETDYPLAAAQEVCRYFEDGDYAGLLANAARLTSAGLALGDE